MSQASQLSGKESACQCRRLGFDPWVRKIPWRRKWQPTPVFLPGKSRRQRSLVGYRPKGHKEPDTTEATKQQQDECPRGVEKWRNVHLGSRRNYKASLLGHNPLTGVLEAITKIAPPGIRDAMKSLRGFLAQMWVVPLIMLVDGLQGWSGFHKPHPTMAQ